MTESLTTDATREVTLVGLSLVPSLPPTTGQLRNPGWVEQED